MERLALMPKYDDYVDSGVEWLGDIPASWSLLANKHIFRLKKKQVGKHSNEYDLLSLTLRGVIKRDMENPEGKFPAEFDTYQEVRCGDFIFCLFDVEETPRTVGLSPFNGMITGAYTVFEPNGNFDNRFLYYFYLNLDTKKRLKPLYRGLRNTIPKDSFLSFKTFVPPREQQSLIADFLDKKTTQINDAIAIKEQQISLLKERKQIIIQQSVTQGLDPNVPMKDSGVDWIGKIPAHWEVKRLKYLGKSIIGLTYSPNDLSDEKGGTLVARSSNLYEGKFRYGEKENVYVNCFIPEHLKLKKGDVLICSRNGSRDLIGKCAFVSDADEGNSFGAFTTVFRSKHNEYLFCILNSDVFKMLSGTFLTSTINQLTVGNLNSIFVPLPPSKNERDGIITYINRINGDVERAIEYQKIQIEKLKEYKTTLINSAVTGKIKITPEMVEQ